MENLVIVSLQMLLFLDAEMYPVLQAVSAANVGQPEGLVLHVETTEKAHMNVHHYVFK